jgi:hypothetical protein
LCDLIANPDCIKGKNNIERGINLHNTINHRLKKNDLWVQSSMKDNLKRLNLWFQSGPKIHFQFHQCAKWISSLDHLLIQHQNQNHSVLKMSCIKAYPVAIKNIKQI